MWINGRWGLKVGETANDKLCSLWGLREQGK
jgi:hypothetical protein